MEHTELISIVQDYLRTLDTRLTKATEEVLPTLSGLEHIEAHSIYRDLLWDWQRTRLAYIMLKLEHPQITAKGVLDAEAEYRNRTGTENKARPETKTGHTDSKEHKATTMQTTLPL